MLNRRLEWLKKKYVQGKANSYDKSEIPALQTALTVQQGLLKAMETKA